MAPETLPPIIPGKQYGYWTALEDAGMVHLANDVHPRRHWLCRCICGTERLVQAFYLKNGRSSSCGCMKGKLQREALGNSGGHRSDRTPTYNTWRAMRARCKEVNNHKYRIYGALGITVCERWESFANFLEDMGERPEGKTLDRIDPYGNYEPSNCRWATIAEQNANTKRKFSAQGYAEHLAQSA